MISKQHQPQILPPPPLQLRNLREGMRLSEAVARRVSSLSAVNSFACLPGMAIGFYEISSRFYELRCSSAYCGLQYHPSLNPLHCQRTTNIFEANVRWIGDGMHGPPVAHAPVTDPPQSANGSRTRIVSSRSGLVETSATGHWISSSTRRIYLIAWAGSSAQLRAPAVDSLQPSMLS